MNNKLSLLVFDWDGTLMDSERNIVQSMQLAFEQASLARPSSADIRRVIGLALDRAITRLLPEGHGPELALIEEAYRAHFRQAGGPSPLFENAADVLAELKRRDYTLAVATGKSRAGLERAIAESGLGGVFDATRSADQCASKPAPEMLEQLLFETGVNADRTIMIGDTTYDLEMANNAGTFAAAVSYGAHDVDELSQCNPSFFIEGLAELPGKLDQFEVDRR